MAKYSSDRSMGVVPDWMNRTQCIIHTPPAGRRHWRRNNIEYLLNNM